MQNKIFRPVITSLFVLVLFSFIPLAGLYAEEGSNNTEFVTIEKHKEQFTENIDGVEYNTTGYDYDTLVLPGNASLGLRLFAMKYNQKIKDYVENEYLPKSIPSARDYVLQTKHRDDKGITSFNSTIELGSQNAKVMSFMDLSYIYGFGMGGGSSKKAYTLDPLVGSRIEGGDMVLNPEAFADHFALTYVQDKSALLGNSNRVRAREEIRNKMEDYLSGKKKGPTFFLEKNKVTVLFKGDFFQEDIGLAAYHVIPLELNTADLEGIFDLSYCE